MKQMTIRNFDPELERAIEEVSRQRGWSINQVAVDLMRRGLGLTTEAAPCLIGEKLDGFFGIWDAKEVQKFQAEVEEAFGQVDEENWR